MRITILALFLFTAFSVNAQTSKNIDSFLGIKLGSSKVQVIAGLKSKGGVFEKTESEANLLIFTKLSLAGREAEYVLVQFIDNKAYQAIFVFKSELETETVDLYNNLVTDINGVYGDGKAIKEFKTPYEDGDGSEILAIKTGYASYATSWGVEDDKQPGTIIISISSKLKINLSYTDKKLKQILDQRTDKKNKSEF